MVNVVMIAKNRPRLTRQTLESLFLHTDPQQITLAMVNDASHFTFDEIFPLDAAQGWRHKFTMVSVTPSKGIVGLARNIGIAVSERYWGRGDLLYLSDNDAYFTQGWLDKLLAAWEACERRVDVARNPEDRFEILGAYNHPYHGIAGAETGNPSPVIAYEHGEIREHYALGGFSWLLRWDTWDDYGPFDAHMPGVCKSEDYAFCQKVRAKPFSARVGAVWPPLVYNCGLTNTFGEKAVGHEAMPLIPGIIME